MITNPVIDMILSRRSVREYDDRPVSREHLETIMACGVQAPSASNKQPWEFVAITDKALLEEINNGVVEKLKESDNPALAERARSGNFHVFHHAPCAIMIFGSNDFDCGILATVMNFAAESLGVRSCMLGFPNWFLRSPEGADVCKRLGMPEGYKPQLMLALGYHEGQPAARERDASKARFYGE